MEARKTEKPKRERHPDGRFKGAHDDERYDVSVWNVCNGDHVKQLWDVTYAEVEEVEEEYRADPEFDVVVEPRF